MEGTQVTGHMKGGMRKGWSDQHVAWEAAKREASQVIDVRVFNLALGNALDALRDVCEAALEIKKVHKTLDDRTKGPVRDRKNVVDRIVSRYVELCKARQRSLGGELQFVGGQRPGGQRIEPRPRDQIQREIDAWNKLERALSTPSWSQNMTRKVLN
jgi:hypothetical protein